jgi:hypothetical protein
MKFIIIAFRTNTETAFYTNSPSQGQNMIGGAWSMARRFDSKEKANEALPALQEKWKGLKNWRIEPVLE